MNDNLERFNKIKKAVDAANKEAAQAEGAENQIMQSLEDEFDCNTIKEAKVLLKRLEKEKEEEQASIDEELTEVEEEHGELFND